MTSLSRNGRTAVFAGPLTAAIIIAQQVAGKAVRDTLFLTNFGAAELPKMMIAAAVLSLVAVGLMSRLLPKHGPAVLVPLVFAISSGLFVAEWFLSSTHPELTGILVYLHLAVFGAIAISGFWSVVTERFDPHEAKRQMARIGSGATFGGVIGGLGAERLAVLLDVRSTLWILAILNLFCALGVARLARGSRPPKSEPSASDSGLTVLRNTPYLRKLAVVVTLVAITAALLDYTFKAAAVAEYTSEGALMRFFALFYMLVSVATFLLQTTLAKRALKKLGLAGTMALLPLSVLAFGALGGAVGRLWSLALVRATEFAMANSLFRSGYELLYTPIPPHQKRPTKTIIDVACERFGDALGAAITLVVIAVLPAFTTSIVIGLMLAFAAASLWIIRQLHAGYVEALGQSLRAGTVQLSAAEVHDATTRRTLSETGMAIDREDLLHKIQRLRESQRPESGATSATDNHAKGNELAESSGATGRERPDDAPSQVAAKALDDGIADVLPLNADRLDELLGKRPFPIVMAGFAIRLLADERLRRPATKALTTVAGRVVGQLVDALVDAEQPIDIRRRVPRLLARSDQPRAANGLFSGLADPRFGVRHECARALEVMLRRVPDALPRSQEDVFQVVLQEVRLSRDAWKPSPASESSLVILTVRKERQRRLQHLFTLLSLTLERETLRVTLLALNGDDEGLHGTALEYLENVLPTDVREGIWPLLAPKSFSETPTQEQAHMVEDLQQSLDSFRLDRQLLVKD